MPLHAAVISGKTLDERLRLIRMTQSAWVPGCDLDEHLPFYDHGEDLRVLTQLAHLARRCCRKHGTEPHGKDAE